MCLSKRRWLGHHDGVTDEGRWAGVMTEPRTMLHVALYAMAALLAGYGTSLLLGFDQGTALGVAAGGGVITFLTRGWSLRRRTAGEADPPEEPNALSTQAGD